MRLRVHHRNLLALTLEEKKELYSSFESQLVPLANHITALKGLPEFKGAKYLADLLLKPGKSLKQLNNGQFLTTNQTNLKEKEKEVGDGKEEEKQAEIVEGEEEVFSQSGLSRKICIWWLELLVWLRRGWTQSLLPSASLSPSMPKKMCWLKRTRTENIQWRKMFCSRL